MGLFRKTKTASEVRAQKAYLAFATFVEDELTDAKSRASKEMGEKLNVDLEDLPHELPHVFVFLLTNSIAQHFRQGSTEIIEDFLDMFKKDGVSRYISPAIAQSRTFG